MTLHLKVTDIIKHQACLTDNKYWKKAKYLYSQDTGIQKLQMFCNVLKFWFRSSRLMLWIVWILGL